MYEPQPSKTRIRPTVGVDEFRAARGVLARSYAKTSGRRGTTELQRCIRSGRLLSSGWSLQESCETEAHCCRKRMMTLCFKELNERRRLKSFFLKRKSHSLVNNIQKQKMIKRRSAQGKQQKRRTTRHSRGINQNKNISASDPASGVTLIISWFVLSVRNKSLPKVYSQALSA